MQRHTTQVIIVGGGPNGIAAAHYMGLYGLDCVVLETATDILPYPRAVGMDDEALRVLQTVGVAEAAHRDMVSHVPLRYYNARGVCFAEVDPSSTELGWPMRNLFMQQILEGTMRELLAQRSNVELRLGHEMTDLRQDTEGVHLTVRDPAGASYALLGQFLIAADGARSTARKLLDIDYVGLTHPRKWVVVDATNDSLDAPYTALHADPKRPFVCIHLPYQQRRWEFMLLDGEDEEQMCQESVIREMIRGHIGDAVDKLEIIRIRAYTHNSRVASRFVEGRVALIGDAAHITPPWAGQGLNSGLRDVGNLCWKVAAIVKGYADPGILPTYDLERRGHATDLITLADNMGLVLGMTHPLIAGVRDWLFQAFDHVEALRDHLVQFKFKPKATLARGLLHRPYPDVREGDLVGQLFIQPDVLNAEGQRVKFDEVLGPWYAVVGFRDNPAAHLSAEARAFWTQRETRFIQVNRSRSGTGRDTPLSAEGALSVEDVDNRLGRWFTQARDTIAVIRPDRFVAALTTPDRLEATLNQLAKQLTSGRV